MPTAPGSAPTCSALHPETHLGDGRRAQRPALRRLRRRSPPDVAVVHVHEADRLGNVRMDPKLVWMDTELVKAAAHVDRDRRADRGHRARFRAAPERTTYSRLHGRPRRRGALRRLADVVLSRVLLRRRLLPRLPARTPRDPEAFAAARSPSTSAPLPTAARRPLEPEDDDWYTIDELMVTALAREFTTTRVAFNGAVSFVPGRALPARPRDARARSRLGRELDRGRRRTRRRSPSRRSSDGLWDGATMLPVLGVRLLGLRPVPAGSTRSASAAPRSTPTATSTTP